MRKFRILALVLALLVILPAVVACKKTDDNGDGTGDNTKEVVYQPVDPADAVEHKDYTSVYDMIGAKVTIDMVTENDDGSSTSRDGTSSFPKFRFTPTSISISTTLRSKTSRPLLTGVPRMLS